ncbi:PD-(D/E)XK nuclease family protein [Palleronia rufa]|uniref:PD-(D/E)XK nuclease family protein n=1 Tax=Palleronia rufa TaxID=1530186 RepID=UPI000563D967|nr:PD-(D/E)XK nuclease family protein [Palleronia rufa]
MFEAQPTPRVFGLPPGADFPAELIRGLESRLGDAPPEDWARVEIFVNTARMQRRLTALFAAGPPRLLPRIRLLTRLAADPLLTDLPPPEPALRRRLALAQLVRRMIQADPTLAPVSAVHDLAGSLAQLFDEMGAEGVSPDVLERLDVANHSSHWQRALRFLTIVREFLREDTLPGADARLRLAAETLAARWALSPPAHPVIVAGSTGSRGPVALLMEAVARLPQGAVVLPGVDFAMPAAIWNRLSDPMSSEDHPQYRFARLARALDMEPAAISRWSDCVPVPARNALVSMALRPAPVTDQWMREGPSLGDMRRATTNMTLIEAADPAEEAEAIAMRLRGAVDADRIAALITPDRGLTRRVQAALDRWDIVADDSAGLPLHLTAPGRLLRQTAALIGTRPDPEALLALLKHPLTGTGGDRRAHLLRSRTLDLWLRKEGAPELSGADLRRWAARDRARGGDAGWAEALAASLDRLAAMGAAETAALVAGHLAETERLAPDLWQEAPGRTAQEAMRALADAAGAAGAMTPSEYRILIDAHLSGQEVRRPDAGRPDVMIWGTLEARVQGADLVILAGLSEGTWPEAPAPDPWLNRSMRQAAGLLLPERRIGLSAHDFQQAIAAPEVVLSRSARDAEAETVMSRWLNRLTNLLAGLTGSDGPAALEEMRDRGRVWIDAARAATTRVVPGTPARRPAPRPPLATRPAELSVTELERLSRDPYAIYARRVLGLRALQPPRPTADAPLRGTVFHAVMERAIHEIPDPADPGARAAFLTIADDVLAEVPWRTTRLQWQVQLAAVADWVLAGEVRRRSDAAPLVQECSGRYEVPGLRGFVLTGKADRIDRRDDGRLVIYDYKTGMPPSLKVMRHYDRQLLLEAIMAEAGAFDGAPAAPVAAICHIGLGRTRKDTPHPLRDPGGEDFLDPAVTLAQLQALIGSYRTRGQGYVSRRAMQRMGYAYDYDHLARYGEWTDADAADPGDVG